MIKKMFGTTFSDNLQEIYGLRAFWLSVQMFQPIRKLKNDHSKNLRRNCYRIRPRKVDWQLLSYTLRDNVICGLMG